MSDKTIEIIPEEQGQEEHLIASPHNMIVFCEKPWRVPAMILSGLVVFTFIWGLYVLETWRDGEDILDGYDFSVSESLFHNTAMNAQTNFAEVVAPAVVGIAGGRVNAGITGRGAIIDSSGHVITSLSLIHGLSEIKVYVQANDGLRVYGAQIVKSVPKHDMAVVKLLTRDRFLFFKMGDVNQVMNGQHIYAFANNMQGQMQLVQGNIQAANQNRTIGGADVSHLMSTSVMYQPYQTGGPVINHLGEMVGMGVVLPGANNSYRGFMIPSSVIQGHFRDVVNFKQAGPLRPVQPQQANIATMNTVALPNTGSSTTVVENAWWRNARMQVQQPVGNVPANGALLPNDGQMGALGNSANAVGAITVDAEHKAYQLIDGYTFTDIVALMSLALFAGVAGGMMTMGGGVIQVAGMMVFFGYGMYLIRPVAYLTNIFVYGASALRNHKANLIVWSNVKPLLPWAIMGIVAGYFIGNHIDDRMVGILLGLFALLMVAKGLHELFGDHPDKVILRENLNDENEHTVHHDASLEDILHDADSKASQNDHGWMGIGGKDVLLGLPMGLISGVLGISGGVVEVPLQRYVAHMSLQNAIANSSVLVFWASVTGAIVAFSHGLGTGLITWQAPLVLAAIMIPGAYIGGRLGARLMTILPIKVLKWIYVAIMSVIAVRMLAG